jgi:hypothetical protein
MFMYGPCLAPYPLMSAYTGTNVHLVVSCNSRLPRSGLRFRIPTRSVIHFKCDTNSMTPTQLGAPHRLSSLSVHTAAITACSARCVSRMGRLRASVPVAAKPQGQPVAWGCTDLGLVCRSLHWLQLHTRRRHHHHNPLLGAACLVEPRTAHYCALLLAH